MKSKILQNPLIRQINTFSKIFNIHLKNKTEKDIFIFSAPRSGSTWLMEMISTQRGIKYYSEPTNIREKYISKMMGVTSWSELLPNENRDKIFENYFRKLQQNKVKFYNPSPFQPNHWFITNRTVFKMMYANDMIRWLEKHQNGQCIFLIRHPIPVSLSRRGFPVLDYFINNSEYMKKYFSDKQINIAKKITCQGSHLEKGTIDWILQNKPPLMQLENNKWLLVTYEEMVLNTEKVIYFLAEKLNLKDPSKILKRSKHASKTAKTGSDANTIEVLNNSKEKNKRDNFLVSKWKDKVTESEEKYVFDLINLFEIDIYSYNNVLPNKKYLNFSV